MNFTHFDLTIDDIKKIKPTATSSAFYKIKFKKIDTIVSVAAEILDNRICAYFLKDSIKDVSRNDIMSCKFNINATVGTYYRLVEGKLVTKFGKSGTLYVNFIEIVSPILNIEGPYFNRYVLSTETTASDFNKKDTSDDLPF